MRSRKARNRVRIGYMIALGAVLSILNWPLPQVIFVIVVVAVAYQLGDVTGYWNRQDEIDAALKEHGL